MSFFRSLYYRIVGKYPCNKCDLVFDTERGLNIHIAIVHDNKN